jgi:hypothetical protein
VNSLTVEVTRNPVGHGMIATFIRDDFQATSYHVDGRRYDRLARLANSGDYAVEILDSDYGVGWTMRRKGVDR